MTLAPLDSLAGLGSPCQPPEVEQLWLSPSLDAPRPASVVSKVPAVSSSSPPSPEVPARPRQLLVYSRRRGRFRPPSPAADGARSPGSPWETAVERLLSSVARPAQQLLPRPAAPRRRSRSRGAASLPRRSRRIAGSGPCSPGPVLNDAQKKVIKCLGLLQDVEKVSQEALDNYCKLFLNPLTDAHLSALAALFGWKVEDAFQARAANSLAVSC